MSELGKLYYSLGLQDKDFETKVTQATREVKSLDDSMLKAVSTAKALGKMMKTISSSNGASVSLRANQQDIQKQLDAFNLTAKVRLVADTSGLGTSSTSAISAGNTALGQRSDIQERITRRATDELGIRRSINDQMSRNTQIATMLGNAMGNVFATYQIQRFLEALVQVGGEIQRQRMALGHILGNDSEANVLFGQMKDLAVKSPFGLMDLMKNARQLSAFGVEYNNLYDTMKRLSDVAAGLGIQFQRIALAYGETKERGFLDGKLVRQFSYMGLPVVQKIADYYTEINKRGNGSIFDVTDVRKMISNKEVSFEDLDAVIQRLTDAEKGGQFANMQEVMAESVAGKWKNVADSIDIMYSNITEGNSELLKAPAEILMSLTRNYEEFIPVLELVATALIGAKVASALFTATMGEQVVATNASMVAEKQADIALKQREALMNGASVAELRRIASQRQLTLAEIQNKVASGELAEMDAKYIVMQQGVNAANAEALASYKLISVAEKETLMNGNIVSATWTALRIKTRFLGQELKLLAANFAEAASVMMANPMTWLMAAVGAVMEISSAWNEASEAQEKAHKGMQEHLRELGEDAAQISNKVTLDVDVEGNITNTAAETKTAIDELVKFIKDKMPGAQQVLDEAFELNDAGQYAKDIEERYQILYGYYQKIKNMSTDEDMEGIGSAVESAFEPHWWNKFFNDDLLRDASDMEKNFNNLFDTLREVIGSNIDDVKPILEEWQKKLGQDTLEGLYNELMKPSNFDKLKEFKEEIGRKIGTLDDISLNFSFNNFKNDMSEYESELKSAMSSIETRLKATYPNFSWNNITVEQRYKIAMELRSYLDNSDASEWVKNHMTEDFKTNWNIDISMSGDVNEAMNILKERYGQWAGDTVVDSHKNLRDQYKKDKKALEDLQNSTLKGLKPGTNGEYSAPWVDQTDINEANALIKNLAEERAKAAKDGIDLEKEYQDEVNKSNKSGSGSKTDQWLKSTKEQFEEIKKTWDAFKKWEEQTNPQEAAQELFAEGLISKDEINKIATDPQYFEKKIKDFKKSVQDKLKGSVEREKFKVTLNAYVSDLKLQGIKKAADVAKQKAQQEINSAMKRFDIYTSWMNATGDENLSTKMSLSVSSMDDKSTLAIKEQLKKALGDAYKEVDWSENANMDKMKDLFGEKFSGEFVKYQEAWKKTWQNGYDFTKKMSDTYKQFLTYSEKINAIDGNLADQVAKIDQAVKNNTISKDMGDRMKNGLTANADWNKLQLSPDYLAYFNNIYSLTLDKAIQIGNAIKKNLDEKLQRGTISAEDYYKEIKRINDQLNKLENRKSITFATEGLNGLQKRFQENAESSYKSATADVQKYAEELNAAKSISEEMDSFSSKWGTNTSSLSTQASQEIAQNQLQGAQAQQQAASAAMEGAGEMASTVAVIDTIVNGINNMVQGIKKTVDEIDEMEESYGKDTSRQSATRSFWSTFSNASQSATDGWNSLKNGDMGGVISGVVGSWTSIFTGINQYIDAGFDDMIKDSKEFADSLKNVTDRMDDLYGSSILLASTAINKISGAYKMLSEQIANANSEMSDGMKTGYGLFTGTSYDTLIGQIAGGGSEEEATYINGSRISQVAIQQIYATKEALETLADAGINTASYNAADSTSKYVMAQYASLVTQRAEVEKQLRAEEGKKDSDSSAISDYQEQLEELDEEIISFSSDIASSLYELDLTSWASDLGDALMEAFANGEDAAEAFADSTQELMQKVSKNLIIQGVLAPWLEELQKKYFGYTDENGKTVSGMFDSKDVNGSMEKIITDLYGEVSTDGAAIISAYQNAFNALNEQLGGSLTSDSSSSTSSSIQSVTEETADILAALVEGMRLDLSIQRTAVEQIRDAIGAGENTRSLNAIAEAQVLQLQQIATNTYNTHQELVNLNSKFDEVTAGTKSLSIQ